MERLYTISEAADILHLTTTTLRRRDRQGKLKYARLSNSYCRILESEVNRIMGKKADKMEGVESVLYGNRDGHARIYA